MSIGFGRSAQHVARRPLYGPGTGRKLGYYATGPNGEQFLQAEDGRVVARILRWNNDAQPTTDSSACAGMFVPGL